MRRKTIIEGFRNSQRFRWIVRDPQSGFEVGMYGTVKSLTEDFATTTIRAAVWEAVSRLGRDRRQASKKTNPQVPIGLLTEAYGVHVQVDLID